MTRGEIFEPVGLCQFIPGPRGERICIVEFVNTKNSCEWTDDKGNTDERSSGRNLLHSLFIKGSRCLDEFISSHHAAC